MPGRERGERPAIRANPERAWGISILTLGLLLFTWPFVRTPLLGIGLSYAHLLASWVAIVTALHLMSRALGRSRGRDDDDA